MHTIFFLSVHLPMAIAIVSANSIHLLLKRCVTAKDLILTLGWLKSEPWLSGFWAESRGATLGRSLSTLGRSLSQPRPGICAARITDI